jgi:predicted amidohydrolase YtcJ
MPGAHGLQGLDAFMGRGGSMGTRLTTYIVVLIVTATVVAGLIVGAQRAGEDGPVDLIVTNGRVFTGVQGKDFAEALAIRGNKILRVGSNRQVKRLARPHTLTLDAHGATVMAGFDDSHAHLLSGAMSLSQLDLSGVSTLDGIESAVRDYAEAHRDRPWVVGRGWVYEAFPGGLPTRQVLDQLVPDRPAYLEGYDGHTGWANSRALAAAGIGRRTKNPAHGEIVRDARGEPTGALKESATGLVEVAEPKATRAEQLQALRDAIALAHTFGITSVQNASGTAEDFELLDELRQRGELALRVSGALTGGPELSPADLDRFEQIRRRFPDDPVLKAGAVKLFADGVVESYTAAMLAPYANKRTTGESNFTPASLTRLVTLLDRRGWQILTHAIGDRAIRMTLDAYQHAAEVNPAPPNGRRHRIEHIETLDPADLPRFATLGVVASLQPDHGDPAPEWITLWKTNLGEARASRGWMYGSLLSSGAHVAFGSDWPVVSLDPRYGLHVAVTRTSPDGTPAGGWIPSEKVTLTQALEAYTSGGAWASFDEQRKGTLQPGMLADIVILSADLFAQNPPRVLDAEVAVTIFDGQVVYERRPGSPTD